MDATVKLRVQNRGPEPQAPPRPILMLYQTRGYVRTSTRHRISAPFFFLYPSVPARRYSLNDVVPPFPPRGHLDDHNGQAKVQVLSKLPAGNGLLQVPVRGRQDAGVALNLLPASNALEALLLEKAQELHLDRGRQLTVAP